MSDLFPKGYVRWSPDDQTRCRTAHHSDPADWPRPPEGPDRQSVTGLRIRRQKPSGKERSEAPKRSYKSAVARHYAEQGKTKFAELVEAGHGCAACHLTRADNGVPVDEDIDLGRYERVAVLAQVLRGVLEVTAEGVMNASVRIQGMLKGASKITVSNVSSGYDPAWVQAIGQAIVSDPVAYRAYQQAIAQGAQIVFEYGPAPRGVLGYYFRDLNRVEIYMRNNTSLRETVSSVVHEASHVHRHFRGNVRTTQLDEVRARAREFYFQFRRRPTLKERRAIWEEVRSLEIYEDIPVR